MGLKETIPRDRPGLAAVPLAPAPSRAPSSPSDSEAGGAACSPPAGGRIEPGLRPEAPSGARQAGRERGGGRGTAGSARPGTTCPWWGLGAVEEGAEGAGVLSGGAPYAMRLARGGCPQPRGPPLSVGSRGPAGLSGSHVLAHLGGAGPPRWSLTRGCRAPLRAPRAEPWASSAEPEQTQEIA